MPTNPPPDTAPDPDAYRDLAEAAWAWGLAQVRYDDTGPWFPRNVPVDGTAPAPPAPDIRMGYHEGIGGLAHALAEIRLTRPWSRAEDDLAGQITVTLLNAVPEESDATFFDGLPSTMGALLALDPSNTTGAAVPLARLLVLATPTGWAQPHYGPPKYAADTKIHDAVLGTAGVLLAAVHAGRHGVAGASELATAAVDVLVADAEPTPAGTNWRWIPERYLSVPGIQMPNWSHGLAGIAASVALAGNGLGRPELIDLARWGAEHLTTLADPRHEGLAVPRTIPHRSVELDGDEVTFNWCQGAAGTTRLFSALEHAGVGQVAGEATETWRRRCLHAVRASGVPQRRHSGFWDNDGRCCGTAGVGDVFLDSWQRTGQYDDLAFAALLGDTLVDHAILEGGHAYWRFVEYRLPEPLLPPGVGWMQGATGIAAYLFRLARLVEQGRGAERAERMETWWDVPTTGPVERLRR